MTDATRRLLAPDLARGVMLLLIGMAYAPFYVTGVATGGYGVRPDGGAIDQAASFLAALLLENRAFPMFAILFGYGLAITARRLAVTAPDGVRKALRRRGLVLLGFGLVHATLVFPGEILGAYGLAALLLAGLVLADKKWLVRLVFILFAVYAATTLGASLAIVGAAGSAPIPSYVGAEAWIERIVGALVAPLFNAIFYPLLLLVVIGLLAGRHELLDGNPDRGPLLERLTLWGIALSVLGALPLALAGVGVFVVDDTLYAQFLALQIMTGVAGGLGYVALFGLLGPVVASRGAGPFATLVAAAGRRSLTTYLLVSSGICLVMHHQLLGLGDHVGRAGAMGIAALAWLIALAIAGLLERGGRPGPADALLRRLAAPRPA